jgi:hypothetical protein
MRFEEMMNYYVKNLNREDLAVEYWVQDAVTW